ncbi:RecE family exodeoxyribonuclease [Enterobacter quasiroggenkampii]|uniref:RecE family exodeoxyribonuclease n=1 Tax=Enterobacter quasiroggenkampii TaxID=2497436 RepID=UPI0021D3A136|nr:RecE family exodeoxyribonuclease [Enterobacter quasiroggenkampii]MCU6322062.1 PD-(D/E)XK nuclease-like domain-containing protein [Enterobacter quasiroggenkampii]
MEFFYVVKATQKSGKEDAVIWFTAKSEARANLQLDVELEDAGIETGRGKDYAKPVRTDFPVFDDLPEESTVDYTWCKRYELDEDQRTWKVKLQHEDSYQNSSEQSICSNTDTKDTKMPELITVATLPLRQRILAQFISDEYAYHIDTEQKKEIQQLEMDVDNSYVQNMLLAAENVDAFKKATEFEIARVVEALKTVFPLDGKRTELSLVIHFFKTWFNTEHIDRGILVREWAAGNRISNVQRTDSRTNADGGYVTDRGEGAHHTLDTLDLEIACALLPMDFHHFEIPSSVLRRAKEIVAKKEEPWKSWSAILRNQPGVLAVNRAAIFNLIRIAPENIHHTPAAHLEFVNKTMTAEFNSAVELLPLPTPAVETEAPVEQPQVENLGSGVFSIDGLIGGNNDPRINTTSNEVEKTENTAETASDVQMEAAKPEKDEDVGSVPPGESTHAANSQTDSVEADQLQKTRIDVQESNPEVEFPADFEPGRYVGLPNNVYHAANGISSTQVKDARVSLMYFNARHVAKTIPRTASKVLDMGNLVHALALQPENLEEEFSVEPEIPEGAFTTTATLREFIDAYNASIPALLSADEIKALLEQHNASLPAPVPLGASLEETAQSYMALPAEYQRIEEGQKQTATAMKACIKEYNANLQTPVKTSGSRDALLEQLAIINPDLVAQEAQKPTPLKVSGTKAEMIQAVKSVKPDAIFADELLDAWRDNPGEKILVTRQQLATARAIQSALLAHPTAGMLLTHPSRAVEVSYFGFDDETGLEVRVRPDLEIDLDGVRIGADLKTISMWNVKQESLRARLHREIIDRDYHISAAMYCQTAALDQFFWIFVNKDENYHWIAIIEASTELLELGMLEYRKTMRAIATGFDTGEWPAPITTDYTDELNDFDLRRLEALRAQA